MVTITGGNRNVILGIKGIEGRRFFERRTTVGETVVFDIVGKNITIEMLSMSCNDKNKCILRIKPYKLNGVLDNTLGIVLYDGSSIEVMSVTPENLNTHKSGFLDELVYDVGNLRFKMGFKEPMKFPNGAKAEIIVGGTPQNMNCLALVSVEGE